MASKKTLEAVARTLNESKILGLFAEGTAHEIVTNQFADIFEAANPLFKRDLFLVASGVKIVTNEEPVRKVCPNSMARKR